MRSIRFYQMITFLLFSVSFICCNQQSEIEGSSSDEFAKTEYHGNGKVKMRVTLNEDGLYHGWQFVYSRKGHLETKVNFVNGVANGKAFEYHESGTLKGFVNYDESGQLQGECVEYYPDGQILTKGNFVDNKYEGLWVTNYPNGVPRDHSVYSKSKLHGYQKAFHTNGVLAVEGEMIDGKEEGVWKFYDTNTDLLNEKHYENGEIVHIEKYIDSQLLDDR